MDPVNASAKFEVRTSPVLEITAIGALVGVDKPSDRRRDLKYALCTIVHRAVMTDSLTVTSSNITRLRFGFGSPFWGTRRRR